MNEAPRGLTLRLWFIVLIGACVQTLMLVRVIGLPRGDAAIGMCAVVASVYGMVFAFVAWGARRVPPNATRKVLATIVLVQGLQVLIATAGFSTHLMGVNLLFTGVLYCLLSAAVMRWVLALPSDQAAPMAIVATLLAIPPGLLVLAALALRDLPVPDDP